jgi:hypothetical protein
VVQLTACVEHQRQYGWFLFKDLVSRAGIVQDQIVVRDESNALNTLLLVDLCGRLLTVTDFVHQVFSFRRRHNAFELRRQDVFRSVICDLLAGLVVLTWRHECAFGAPLFNNQVTLQLDCRHLELFEALLLK